MVKKNKQKENRTVTIHNIINKSKPFFDKSIEEGIYKLRRSLLENPNLTLIPKNEYFLILYKIFDRWYSEKKHNENKKQENLDDDISIDFKCSLSSIFNKKEIQNIATEILDVFSSSKKYSVRFIIPNIINKDFKELKLNDSVSLKFDGYGSPGTLSSVLQIGKTLNINITHYGYLSESYYAEPYAIFKHVLYLALCLNIFKIGTFDRAPGLFGNFYNSSQCCGGFTSDKVPNEYQLNLPDQVISFLSRLELNKDNDIEGLKLLALSFDFLNNENNVYVGKILSALEWGFESEIVENETFRFIFKMVALEALLGDDHERPEKSKKANSSYIESTGVTKTLRDRLAYFLAEDHIERKSLIADFNEAYHLRSRLLHGSHTYLKPEEKAVLDKVDSWLKRALFKELVMLSPRNSLN